MTNPKRNWFIAIPVILLTGFLAWYFSSILLYILVATVLSLIGRPLVRLLDNIRIHAWKFPHTLSAVITLLMLFGVFFGLFALIVPLLISQASALSGINSGSVVSALQPQLDHWEIWLRKYQLLNNEQTIEAVVTEKLTSFIGKTNISEIMSHAIDFVGSFFVAVFAIGFITFFFLKNERMLLNGIMLFTPVEYQTEIKHVYIKTIRLLSRYFTGLLLDLSIVMTLITFGMWLFGFENALMIGIFAGMMNVVPYVGPIIGAGIALFLGITGNIEPGVYTDVIPMVLKILGVLVCVNVLDAFFMQPTIYSNRVRAHPLEIFLVILLSGSVAGIAGMVLAIPTYTVLRIIGKEFFSKWRFVRKITEKI